MRKLKQRHVAMAAGTLFCVESLVFYALAAAHLGVPVELNVQPRGRVAAMAAVCAVAMDGAAITALIQSDAAWQVGIAAHVLVVAAVLMIDMVVASPGDGTAVYRGCMAMVAVTGLLMMTTPAKAALGHPDPKRKGRR